LDVWDRRVLSGRYESYCNTKHYPFGFSVHLALALALGGASLALIAFWVPTRSFLVFRAKNWKYGRLTPWGRALVASSFAGGRKAACGGSRPRRRRPHEGFV
jgi:hypothetical protein